MDPQIDGIRANSVSDIRGRVRLWDLFYGVQYETIDENVLEIFRERCVRKGYSFELPNLVWRNKIAPIVNKRAESIPKWFNFECDDPAVQEWLEAWVDGAHFDSRHSLWRALREWNFWLERHGNVILKLTRGEDGAVEVSRMDPRWCDKLVNPENYSEVLAWEFSYEIEGQTHGGRSRSIGVLEYIDAEVFRRYENGKLVGEWVHGLGWIPVVHIMSRPGDDRLWGESIIADLIEPQIQMVAASSMIRACNRWQGWPAFAGAADRSLVDLRPGGYTYDEHGNTVRVLSWSSDIRSVEAEERRHETDMYERGRVSPWMGIRPTGDEAPPGLSGRALLVLTRDGIEYIRAVVSDLEEYMRELLAKVAALAGKLKYDPKYLPVRVTYPPLDIEDDAAKRDKARLIVELYARRLVPARFVIESMKDLGIISTAEETDALLAEAQGEATPEVPELPVTGAENE